MKNEKLLEFLWAFLQMLGLYALGTALLIGGLLLAAVNSELSLRGIGAGFAFVGVLVWFLGSGIYKEYHRAVTSKK